MHECSVMGTCYPSAQRNWNKELGQIRPPANDARIQEAKNQRGEPQVLKTQAQVSG